MASKHVVAKFLTLTFGLIVPVYIAAQTPQFTIQDVGTLPDLPACNGTAISQSGNVAGYCTATFGQDLLLNNITTHVFLSSNGVLTDLNVTYPPTGAVPTAVNDSGVVVGGTLSLNIEDSTGSVSPFIYQNGAVQPFTGPLQSLLPLGINNNSQMIGTFIEIGSYSLNYFVNSKAVLDPLAGGGTLTDLAAVTNGGGAAGFGINSTGTVAGASVAQNATSITPMLWQNLTPQPLPLLTNYSQGIATAINDSGVAAGVAFDLDFETLTDLSATAHAVLFSNGSVTDLGVLQGDVSSTAIAINNSGSVVGFSSNQPPDFTLQLAGLFYPPANNYHAFLYSGGKMYNLVNQLVNGAGWQLSFAMGINNAGQIVGTGFYEGPGGAATVQRAFLLTPVPGPSITSIVGAGFSTPAVTTISPNGLFTIFGSDLASGTAGLTAGEIVNNQLPTNLGGTCVESGTTKWGLFYVSPKQINVVAGELPASGTVPVTVITGCGTANEVLSASFNAPVAATAPEFLYFLENSNGQNPIATIEPNGAYVGTPGLIAGATFAPAHVGDVLTAFGVGWGPTTSPNPPGTIASAIASLTSNYKLTLGGTPVDSVLYAGVSPTYAGLYQVDFTVPSGVSAGNQPLVLTLDEPGADPGISTSPTAYIAIGN
jgi:uncharacterized protein (TIGR03437 family)